MGDTYVIAGLRRKRAQIAGFIADHERKAREWRASLVQLDATLKLFAADLDPETIPSKRPHRQSPLFNGAELARLCLDQLREAAEPISAGAIYEAAVRLHGIPTDPRAKTATVERILRYLREKQEAGLVQKHGITHDARWSLTDAESERAAD